MAKKGTTPTQQFIEIDRIQDGVVILRNGGLRKILMVSGINFDLKSEEEKNLILGTFQSFLNSLNFSLQLFVHSRKLNIEAYLETLSGRLGEETNELLQNQIAEYKTFIKELVSENAIMSKNYFVVVSYDPVGIGMVGRSVKKRMFGFLKKKRDAAREMEEKRMREERIKEHVEQLDQRVEQVVGGLNQLELRAIPLNNEELIELFYNLYNPGTIEKRELEIAKTNGN